MATEYRGEIVKHSDRRQRILVVGYPADSQAIGMFSRACEGADILPCESISSAYGRIRREPFDLVVIRDHHRNFHLIELIRCGLPHEPGPQVIVCSDNPDISAAKKAFRAGAVDYLTLTGGEDAFAESWRRATLAAGRRRRGQFSSQQQNGRDHLTGLVTHRAFMDHLSKLRLHCRTTNESLAVILIDLDGFSQINSAHSHIVGDFVLTVTADRIRRTFRGAEVIARLHADRFGTIVSGLTYDDAMISARNVIESLGRPLKHHSDSIMLRARLGLAVSDRGFLDHDGDLMQRASIALDRARESLPPIVAWRDVERIQPPLGFSDSSGASSASVTNLRLRLRNAHSEATRALVAAVEAKDPYTEMHSLSVSQLSEGLARRMDLPEHDRETLKRAAMLHDVGKIGIPDSILRKPGKLTPGEFDVIRRHPAIGVSILRHANFLSEELPLVMHHHEWFDGRGYPDHLSRKDIPIGARIIGIADAVDAMLSNRSYKRAYHLDRVHDELIRCSGTQFDPELVDLTVDWIEKDPSDFQAERPAPIAFHSEPAFAT